MTTSHWLRLFWGLTGPIILARMETIRISIKHTKKKIIHLEKNKWPREIPNSFFDVLCTTKEGKVIRDKKKGYR